MSASQEPEDRVLDKRGNENTMRQQLKSIRSLLVPNPSAYYAAMGTLFNNVATARFHRFFTHFEALTAKHFGPGYAVKYEAAETSEAFLDRICLQALAALAENKGCLVGVKPCSLKSNASGSAGDARPAAAAAGDAESESDTAPSSPPDWPALLEKIRADPCQTLGLLIQRRSAITNRRGWSFALGNPTGAAFAAALQPLALDLTSAWEAQTIQERGGAVATPAQSAKESKGRRGKAAEEEVVVVATAPAPPAPQRAGKAPLKGAARPDTQDKVKKGPKPDPGPDKTPAVPKKSAASKSATAPTAPSKAPDTAAGPGPAGAKKVKQPAAARLKPRPMPMAASGVAPGSRAGAKSKSCDAAAAAAVKPASRKRKAENEIGTGPDATIQAPARKARVAVTAAPVAQKPKAPLALKLKVRAASAARSAVAAPEGPAPLAMAAAAPLPAPAPALQEALGVQTEVDSDSAPFEPQESDDGARSPRLAPIVTKRPPKAARPPAAAAASHSPPAAPMAPQEAQATQALLPIFSLLVIGPQGPNQGPFIPLFATHAIFQNPTSNHTLLGVLQPPATAPVPATAPAPAAPREMRTSFDNFSFGSLERETLSLTLPSHYGLDADAHAATSAAAQSIRWAQSRAQPSKLHSSKNGPVGGFNFNVPGPALPVPAAASCPIGPPPSEFDLALPSEPAKGTSPQAVGSGTSSPTCLEFGHLSNGGTGAAGDADTFGVSPMVFDGLNLDDFMSIDLPDFDFPAAFEGLEGLECFSLMGEGSGTLFDL